MRKVCRMPVGFMCALTVTILGCGKSHDSGVIIRKITHGQEVVDETLAPQAPSAARQDGPASTATGSTLVADTPRAVYRQSIDEMRRRVDADNIRTSLDAIEAAIEDDKESPL